MASNGSFNTSSYDNKYLIFNWWINRQSVEENYTEIGWNLVGGSSSNTYHMAGNFAVLIDGATVYSSSTRIKLYNGTTVASGTKIIYHNTDGSRKFSAWAQAGIYAVAVNCSGGGEWDLNTIPRASTPTVSGTLQLGSTITIKTNRASNSFIHNLYYSWGPINNQRFATGIGESTTWTIPKDLANHIPNGVSGSLFIICETYNGGTLIGTKTTPAITVQVPDTDEFKPSISEIALSELVDGIFSKFGNYIQNQSKVYCTITAAGAYSSSIKSYKAVVNGATYNSWSFTTDFLKLAGTNTVSVTVNDSRGREKSLSRNFEVLAYEGPTITKMTANRCLQNGTLNDEGEFAKIEMIATIPSLNNKNTYSYHLQYKDTDDDTYVQHPITLTESKTSTTITITGSTIIAADGDNSFDYMFSVADHFLPANRVRGVETVFQLINFNASGKGMAFGKVSEKNALEIAMDMYDKYGQLIGNGLAEYGSIDPDTTLSYLCLTNINVPNNNGFYFVMTLFNSEKSATANRTQIAIPYIGNISQNKKDLYVRQYCGEWNEWVLANEPKQKQTCYVNETLNKTYSSGNYITFKQKLHDNSDGKIIFNTDGTITINHTGYIKVSFNVWLWANTDARPWFRFKNYNTSQVFIDVIDDTSSNFRNFTAANCIIPVNSGDVFGLQATTQTGVDFIVDSGNGFNNSYMSIELI